jgi:hypothetical protein
MHPSLYIVVPCGGGRPHHATAAGITQLALLLKERGIAFQADYAPGSSSLPGMRSAVAAKFLESQFSHLVFIDDDMEFAAKDVLRLALAAEHHDVVAGIYPKKEELPESSGERWTCKFFPDVVEKGLHCCPRCGAIEIPFAPTGFMGIRRGAFERIAAARPDLHCWLNKDVQGTLFFNFRIINGILVGEDYGFCALLRECGGTVWALPDVMLGHCGGKVFRGRLSDFLTTEQPAPPPSVGPSLLEVCK